MFNSEDISAGIIIVTRRRRRVSKVAQEHIVCPKCEKSDRIETSTYNEADYYCKRCSIWFCIGDKVVEAKFITAMERLED